MDRLPWLVAGFGCRRGCPPAEVLSLLRQALALAHAQLADLKGLATFERRTAEPALVTLVAQVGLPLAGYTASQMTPFEPGLSHRSAHSWRHTGCQGVAESSALAHCHALSGAMPQLLVARQRSAQATVALAWVPST